MASYYSNRLQHEFTWKIKNFSMCSQQQAIALQSPSFKAENIDAKAVWYVNFFPRGNGASLLNHVAFFLVRIDETFPKHEIYCEYSMEIIGSNGEVLCSANGESVFVYSSQGGFENFVNMNDVLKNPAFLPDDTLTFRCRMKGKIAEDSKTSRNFAETKIGFDRITFKWNINNPFYLSKPEVYFFRLGTFGEYQLTYNQAHDKISLSVTQKSKKDPCTKVVLKISFLESNGRESEQIRFDHLFKDPGNNAWLIKNFLTQAELRSKYNQYVWGGALHMNCEFSASNKTQADSIAEYHYCPPICENAPSDVDTVAALMEDLRNLYTNRKFTDVKLICKEQFPIDAHKAILSARSEIFSRMFTDSSLTEMNLPSVTFDILNKFVEYLYTDSITGLDMDSASELMDLAITYDIKSLREYCYQFKNERIEAGEISQFLIFSP